MTGRDVVVVGAGVIGAAIAWRLAAGGATVTLVDPEPGGGASWVAGGMVAPVTEYLPGEERLLALTLESTRRWPTFAAELEAASGVPIHLRRAGTVVVGLDRDDVVAIDDRLGQASGVGLDLLRCSVRELRELEPLLAPDVGGGHWISQEWAVDVRALLGALAAAAASSGARSVRDRVTAVEVDAGRAVGVTLEEGPPLPASLIVVANGWQAGTIGGIPDVVRSAVRPVKGQILRLGSDGPRLQRVVRALVRGRPVYLVPRPDGRVVVGATMEESRIDTTVTGGAVRELLDDACSVVPALSGFALLEASAGLRPVTPDNRPIVGPTEVEGLHLAVGHGRNGILLTPVTSDMVARAVTNGATTDLEVGLEVARFHRHRGRRWS